ncbi:cytochrome c biogenesis protein CcsA [Leptospira noguchii]|uniref:cytochrome c biogenesis protein CcsA n=1 Tax=Leptospira noguchii TaxID=28182 RepID=UPI0002BE7959|nr:cytochrome c biogenesis protein CcsA [Leptospira noguchii]EMI72060.1 cytochrome c assembly protein [Leptospira noguchii str. Bonito]EMS84477.1 cytochrome c assembly protein [Leptospira noguchii str. Cascata]EMS85492.1 cytochrome c assembly protein [Leptospira noguchii str. Hook]TQE71629.1 ABC transporter permease [Leptospira noguchii]UOG38347.1 cytochrome c biogenesis protein [Leptospira noguchii]
MKIKIAHSFWDWVLSAVFLIGFPIVVLFSLNYPNVILQQGTAHRIFYFHVPVAWVALYGPIFSLIFAVLYLIRKESKWDLLSLSANQIALLFAVGVIFSGRIWAASAWGVPWDKTDARLQSFTVLFISLIAYFVFRILITDVSKKKVFSAFLSILCAVNAVITWGAIRWIDNPGNHPESIMGKGGMDSDIRLSFWLGVFAYHVLFLVLFRFVYRLSKIEDLRENLPEREA